jgi:hypothetical protein
MDGSGFQVPSAASAKRLSSRLFWSDERVIDRADSRPDRWAQVWRVLASNRLLLIWLGLLALAALAALWIPQAPRSAYQQDGGVEDWLTSVRPQLGRPADVLVALGLLTVAHSAWLRLVAAGTALTLTLRLFDAAQRLRGAAILFRPVITRRITVPGEPSAALDAVSAGLDRDLRHHIEDEPHHRLIAYRPLGHLGSLLMMAGGLIVMVGWLCTQATGWELSQLRLTEDIPASITPGNLVLHLDSLEVQWGDAETPTSATGELTLEGDDGVAGGALDLDDSRVWNGITFHFDAVGPAVRIKGETTDATPLLLQTAASQPPSEELILPLPPDEGPRSFAAPDEGVVVQMEAEWADSSPHINLRIYQGREGELVEDRTIEDRASIVLDNAHFILDVVPFAEITASRSPGTPLIIAGAILALGGIVLGSGYPARQLHVVALERGENSELVLSVGSKNDADRLTALVRHLDPIRMKEAHED